MKFFAARPAVALGAVGRALPARGRRTTKGQ
jgi:hypothetical protein